MDLKVPGQCPVYKVDGIKLLRGWRDGSHILVEDRGSVLSTTSGNSHFVAPGPGDPGSVGTCIHMHINICIYI